MSNNASPAESASEPQTDSIDQIIADLQQQSIHLQQQAQQSASVDQIIAVLQQQVLHMQQQAQLLRQMTLQVRQLNREGMQRSQQLQEEAVPLSRRVLNQVLLVRRQNPSSNDSIVEQFVRDYDIAFRAAFHN
jgi:translation initiation factor 2B subunit (eIF-2B alpha/beta/delta family)